MCLPGTPNTHVHFFLDPSISDSRVHKEVRHSMSVVIKSEQYFTSPLAFKHWFTIFIMLVNKVFQPLTESVAFVSAVPAALTALQMNLAESSVNVSSIVSVQIPWSNVVW